MPEFLLRSGLPGNRFLLNDCRENERLIIRYFETVDHPCLKHKEADLTRTVSQIIIVMGAVNMKKTLLYSVAMSALSLSAARLLLMF